MLKISFFCIWHYYAAKTAKQISQVQTASTQIKVSNSEKYNLFTYLQYFYEKLKCLLKIYKFSSIYNVSFALHVNQKIDNNISGTYKIYSF